MSPSRMLPRILLCSLVLTSVAGCHHRSAAPARLPAPDAEEAGYGMQATTQSTIGVQTARPNQGGAVTATRIEDLFAGRFAGLEVQRTGTGKVVLRMWGGEPLVVVNGLEGDSHLLLAVRPQDVTRIEVLKDPGATAIYGNRGLHGVVVITTRRRR
jgi:TonB-dependent SusC/RagA subfamily outer membrane receptor